MKKVFVLVLVSLILLPVFAANPATGKVSEATGEGKSATIDYSITLNSNTTFSDSFEIGFSRNAVTSFDSVTAFASDEETLEVKEGDFVGTFQNPVYIYWQIITDKAVTINLSASQMAETGDGNSGKLNVSLETTVNSAAGENINNGTAVKTVLTSDSSTAVSGDVLTLSAGESAAKVVGSQLVTITTENLVDIVSELQNETTYKGTLTAKITTT